MAAGEKNKNLGGKRGGGGKTEENYIKKTVKKDLKMHLFGL